VLLGILAVLLAAAGSTVSAILWPPAPLPPPEVSLASPASTRASPPSPPTAPTAPSTPARTATPTTTPAPVTLSVVALGDSVTAGSHCDCRAFPDVYAADLRSKYDLEVQVTNDGQGGLTSQDTSTALDSRRDTRAEVARADVVILTIGANDFLPAHEAIETDTCGTSDHLRCVRSQLATLSDNLDATLGRIHDLRKSQPTTVLVTGYWNVFEDGDVADRSFSSAGRAASDELTRAVNAVITSAVDRAGDTYVDLYAPFKGAAGKANPAHLLADDGDHPNAAGHDVIAQALLSAGLPPTRSPRA
jgi:lysophospholipase L1-like esterase